MFYVNDVMWMRGNVLLLCLFTWTSRSRVLAAEGNQDRVSRIHWTRTGLFGGPDILYVLLIFGVSLSFIVRGGCELF